MRETMAAVRQRQEKDCANKMIRILHISKYYFPFKGGTEQIAMNCVSALKERYRQKVICFNHEHGDRIDTVDEIEITRAGCFAKIASQSLSVSYRKILKDIIRSYKPHIIIFHYPNPFAAYWLLKYCPLKTKLILYWHLDIVRQKILGKLFIRQNYRLIERADAIFCTSPNYIEGSRWLKQAENKCVVIPNCINAEIFEDQKGLDQLAAKIRSENVGKIICLAVGRHTGYKGFTYLIQASKYLDFGFQIYIAGEGELTNRLKKEAEGDSKIRFLGSISDQELAAYMTAMDIFCFPSITKNEAFGLALAEAMYCAKPSVTFTIEGSGVNYVSLNGITGIEVPDRDAKAYAEAIRKLADDPGRRHQYGMAAKKRVTDCFLYRAFAENVRKEIEEIICT